MDKNVLRNKYKALRAALSSETIEAHSLTIANETLKLPIWDVNYYHLFLSITEKKEIDTDFLLHILQGKDKSVIISKSDFETGTMKHYLLQEHTKIIPSAYGIPEPEGGILIAPELLDVVFVPLLAFDINGHRVGYGKGFYDRFLAQCRPDCIKVGLSFFPAEQHIFSESRDFPLDYCVTPQKTYRF